MREFLRSVVFLKCTNQEIVLNGAERQSIEILVDATKDGSTLAPKAPCIDNTASSLSSDNIKPARKLTTLHVLALWHMLAIHKPMHQDEGTSLKIYIYSPKTHQINIRRGHCVFTRNKISVGAAILIKPIFLAVLVSITHQRFANTLACR